MKKQALKQILSFILVFMMAVTIMPSSTLLALAAEPEETTQEVVDISEPEDAADAIEEVAENVSDETLENDESQAEVAADADVSEIEEINGDGEATATYKVYTLTEEKYEAIIGGESPSASDGSVSASASTLAEAFTALDEKSTGAISAAYGFYISVLGDESNTGNYSIDLSAASTYSNLYVRVYASGTSGGTISFKDNAITVKDNLYLEGQPTIENSGTTLSITSTNGGTLGIKYFQMAGAIACTGNNMALEINGSTTLKGLSGFTSLIAKDTMINLADGWTSIDIPKITSTNDDISINSSSYGLINYTSTEAMDLGTYNNTAKVNESEDASTTNYVTYDKYCIKDENGNITKEYVKKDGKYYECTQDTASNTYTLATEAASVTDDDVSLETTDCKIILNYTTLPEEGTQILNFTGTDVTDTVKQSVIDSISLTDAANSGWINTDGKYYHDYSWSDNYKLAAFTSEDDLNEFIKTLGMYNVSKFYRLSSDTFANVIAKATSRYAALENVYLCIMESENSSETVAAVEFPANVKGIYVTGSTTIPVSQITFNGATTLETLLSLSNGTDKVTFTNKAANTTATVKYWTKADGDNYQVATDSTGTVTLTYAGSSAGGDTPVIDTDPYEYNGYIYKYAYYDSETEWKNCSDKHSTILEYTSLGAAMDQAKADAKYYVTIWLEGMPLVALGEEIDIPDTVKGINFIAFNSFSTYSVWSSDGNSETVYYLVTYTDNSKSTGSETTTYAIKKSNYKTDLTKNTFYDYTETSEGITIGTTAKSWATINVDTETGEITQNYSDFEYRIASLDVPAGCQVNFYTDAISALKELGSMSFSNIMKITTDATTPGTVNFAGRQNWANYPAIHGDGNVNIDINTSANFEAITNVNTLNIGTTASNSIDINIINGTVQAKSVGTINNENAIYVTEDNSDKTSLIDLGDYSELNEDAGTLYLQYRNRDSYAKGQTVVTFTGATDTTKYQENVYKYYDNDGNLFTINKDGTISPMIYSVMVMDAGSYNNSTNDAEEGCEYIEYTGTSLADILEEIGKKGSDLYVLVNQVSDEIATDPLTVTIPENISYIRFDNGGSGEDDSWKPRFFNCSSIKVEGTDTVVVIENPFEAGTVNVNFDKDANNGTNSVLLIEGNNGKDDVDVVLKANGGILETSDGTELETVNGFDKTIVHGFLTITSPFGVSDTINDFGALECGPAASIRFSLPSKTVMADIASNQTKLPTFDSISTQTVTSNKVWVWKNDGSTECDEYTAYYYKEDANVDYNSRYTSYQDEDENWCSDETIFIKTSNGSYYRLEKVKVNGDWYYKKADIAASVKSDDLTTRMDGVELFYEQAYDADGNELAVALYNDFSELVGKKIYNFSGENFNTSAIRAADSDYYIDATGTVKLHAFAIRNRSGLEEPEDEEEANRYYHYLDDNRIYVDSLSDITEKTNKMTKFDIFVISDQSDYGTLVLPASARDVYMSVDDSNRGANVTAAKINGIEFQGKKTSLYIEDCMITPDADHTDFTIKALDNNSNYICFRDSLNASKDAAAIVAGTAKAFAIKAAADSATGVVAFEGTNYIAGIDGVDTVMLDGDDSNLYVLAGDIALDFTDLMLGSDLCGGNIYLQGYNKDNLIKLADVNIDENNNHNPVVSIGYYTFSVDDSSSALKATVSDSVEALADFVNFDKDANLENIRKYIQFVMPEDKSYLKVGDDGTVSSMTLANTNSTLFTDYDYGKSEPSSFNTTVTILADSAAEVKTYDKIILATTNDTEALEDAVGTDAWSELVIDEQKPAAFEYVDGSTTTMTTSVTFNLSKDVTTDFAYVLFYHGPVDVDDETITIEPIGSVEIQVTCADPKIIKVCSDPTYTVELDKDTLEDDYSSETIAKLLPETVDVVLESGVKTTANLAWTLGDIENASDAEGAGEKVSFTGRFEAVDDYGNLLDDYIDFSSKATYGDGKTTYENGTGIVYTYYIWNKRDDATSTAGVYTGTATPEFEAGFGQTLAIRVLDGTNSSATTYVTNADGKVILDPITATTTYKVTVKGSDTDYIKDSNTEIFTYTITQAAGALSVEPVADQTYTGAAIKPSVKVYNSNGDLLTYNKDYTTSYANNTKVAASTDTNAPTITIKGKGNYTGSTTVKFNIVAVDGEAVQVSTSMSQNGENYVLICKNNKADLTTAVKALKYGKLTLKAGTDYNSSVTYQKVDAENHTTGITADAAKALTYDDSEGATNTYNIVYTMMGNYTRTKTLTVVLSGKKDFAKVSVKSGLPKSVVYTGTSLEDMKIDTSKVVLKDGSKEIASTAYTAGEVTVDTVGLTASVTFSANDTSDYIGSKTLTYKIVKSKLLAADFSSVEKTLTYDPTKSTFELNDGTLKFKFTNAKGAETTLTLTEDKDYKVTYTKNTAVGKATAVFTSLDEGILTGNVKKTFTIAKKSLTVTNPDKTVIADDVKIYVINGSDTFSVTVPETPFETEVEKSVVKPEVVVQVNGERLTEGKDYKVTYTNNKSVTDTSVAADKIKYGNIKIEGKGNYTGAIDGTKNGVAGLTFIVNGKSLDSSDISLDESKNYIVYNAKTKEYKFKPVVLDGEAALKENTDYTIESYTNNKSTDLAALDSTTKLPCERTEATVKIKGKGNYSGEAEYTFYIVPTSFDKLAITVAPQTFVRDTTATVSKNDISIKLNSKSTDDLFDEDDYYIDETSYTGNTKPGTAKVKLVSTNETYPGSKVVSFKINKGSIANVGITYDEEITYSKAGNKPDVTVTDGDHWLVLGKDYTVSYSNNTKVADAGATKAPTITIKGKGNYSGSVSKTFTISACDISDIAENITVAAATYISKTNAKYTANVTITQDGKKLTNGTDYKVSYPNGQTLASYDPTNYVGNVINVTITPAGNYTGNAITTYMVVAPVAVKNLSMKIGEQTYTGQEITFDDEDTDAWKNALTVSYKVGTTTYTIDSSNFEVVAGSYKKNTKVGTASVVIQGKSDTGYGCISKTVTFKINAYSAAKI